MTKMLLPFTGPYNPNHQFSFNKSKNAIKTLQIENFKRYLMTKNTPYYTTTKEPNKYAGASEIWDQKITETSWVIFT